MAAKKDTEESMYGPQGAQSSSIEEFLTAEGVKFEYDPKFPLSDIDGSESLKNQARMADEFNPEWVEEYREALRRGSRFPALIVAKASAKAKAVNIDGNHRYVAATEEGISTFGAYVVRMRPGSMPFKSLAAGANVRHGHQAPRDERIQHALWAMDNQGATLERAAADQNLPASAVRSRWEKVRANRRATDVGISKAIWDDLAATARTRLLTVGTDEGFKAATMLAAQAKMTIAELDDMLSALAEKPKSASAQEKIVRGFKKDYEKQIAAVKSGERRGGRGGFTPRRRMGMALSSLSALPDDFVDVLASSWDPEERAEGAQQAREGAKKLQELAAALEA